MDKIRQLLMIKWEQRRTVSRKLEGLILPHIVTKLKESSRNLDMEVVKCSNEVGEILVMGGSGIRFVVKLHEKHVHAENDKFHAFLVFILYNLSLHLTMNL
jgi:hypothetical protein